MKAWFVLAVMSLYLVCGECLASPVVLQWPDQLQAGFRNVPLQSEIYKQLMLQTRIAASDDGVVCVIDSTAGDAVLFPRLGSDGSLDSPIRQHLGPDLSVVAFKRVGHDKSYFVIGSKTDPIVYVLDVHSGAIVKTIPIKAKNLVCLAAPSNTDASMIYYISHKPDYLGRVDLVALKETGAMFLPPGTPWEVSASPDGTLLYARHPLQSSNQYRVFKVADGDSFAYADVPSDMTAAREHTFPSPDGGFVAAGRQFYKANGSDTLDSNPVQVQAFSLSRPVMFGIGLDGSISTQTTKGHEMLSSLPWPFPPPDPLPGNPPRTHPSYVVAMFFDDLHRKLIVVNEQCLAVFEGGDIAMDAAALADIDVDGMTDLVAGKPWVATLRPGDPGVTIALADAPPGVTLEGNALHWTPKFSDTGAFEVKLALSFNGKTATRSVHIQVHQEALRLPFIPRGLSVSMDGKRAVIFESGENPQDNQTARIALIDLEKQTVIANRTFLAPLLSVGVDTEYAYAALQNSDVFYALSRNDLSDTKRFFTRGKVDRFETVINRLYTMIGAPNAGGLISCYELPSLKPVEFPVLNMNQQMGIVSSPLPVSVDGGWLVNGAVYDPEMAHVRWLIGDLGFAAMKMPVAVNNMFFANESVAAHWNVRVANGGIIMRSSGQRLIELANQTVERPIILNDLPLAATITRPDQRNANITQLELYNLCNGDRLEPIPLTTEKGSRGYSAGRADHIAAAGNLIVAQVDDRLFVVPLTHYSTEKLGEPFTITPPKGLILIPGNKPTTVKLTIHGGVAPYTFALAEESQAVQIDSSTGVVTIDPQTLLSQAGDAVMEFTEAHFANDPQTRQRRSPRQALDAYKASVASQMKSFSKIDPKGYPVAMTLMITGMDSQQQACRLVVTYLVDVPYSAIKLRNEFPGLPTPRQPAPAIPQQPIPGVTPA